MKWLLLGFVLLGLGVSLDPPGFWVTLHPGAQFFGVLLVGLVGYFLGLAGYTQATRDAYERYVTAHHRMRFGVRDDA